MNPDTTVSQLIEQLQKYAPDDIVDATPSDRIIGATALVVTTSNHEHELLVGGALNVDPIQEQQLDAEGRI